MIARFLQKNKDPIPLARPVPVSAPPTDEYVYLNLMDVQPIDRETLLDGGKTGVWLENGPDLRPFLRGAPRFVDDPDGTGLFAPADTAATQMIYPPAMAVSARQVDLIGYRSFLTRERRFFTDDALLSDRRDDWLRNLRRPEREMNEETGFGKTQFRDAFYLHRNLAAGEQIEGRTVALVSQEPFNYGSFLFRVLAKVATMETLGLMDDPVLVHMPYPSFREALVLAGIKADRLIGHDPKRSYRFQHVVVPGNRNGHALLDPETKAVFARLREASGYAHDGRKLYVARNKPGETLENKWNGRVLMNETALIEKLIPLGFQIVTPGELSMEEQIRTFASAGMVVGGSGSALFNAVFCRPGTKLIDIESQRDWINAHTCLFSSAELDYGIFVGKADPEDKTIHRRWTVNVDALVQRIVSHGK